MNKRIKKKLYKKYHRKFCHVSWDYLHGYAKTQYSDSNQCPKCGWDALEADPDLKSAKILWSRGSFTDYEFEAEYKCPLCGTVFRYRDGA